MFKEKFRGGKNYLHEISKKVNTKNIPKNILICISSSSNNSSMRAINKPLTNIIYVWVIYPRHLINQRGEHKHHLYTCFIGILNFYCKGIYQPCVYVCSIILNPPMSQNVPTYNGLGIRWDNIPYKSQFKQYYKA
jgi:hypothetical protein